MEELAIRIGSQQKCPGSLRLCHRSADTAESRPSQEVDQVELSASGESPKPGNATTPSGVAGPAGVVLDLTLAQLEERISELPTKLLRPKRFKVPFTSDYTEASPKEAAEALKQGQADLVVSTGEETYSPVKSRQDFLALETFLTEAQDGPREARLLEDWHEKGLVFRSGRQSLDPYPAYLALQRKDGIRFEYQSYPVGGASDLEKVGPRLQRLLEIPKDDPEQRAVELYRYLTEELSYKPQDAARYREVGRFKWEDEADQERLKTIGVRVGDFTFNQRAEVFDAGENSLEFADTVRRSMTQHGLERTRSMLASGADEQALKTLLKLKAEDPLVDYSPLLVGEHPQQRLEFLEQARPTLEKHPVDLGQVAAREAMSGMNEAALKEMNGRLGAASTYHQRGVAAEVAYFLACQDKLPEWQHLVDAGVTELADPGVAAEALSLMGSRSPDGVKNHMAQVARFQERLGENGADVMTSVSPALNGTDLEQRMEAAEAMGLFSKAAPLNFVEVKKAVFDLYRHLVNSGGDPGETATRLRAFTRSLERGRSDEKETAQVAVGCVKKAIEKNIPLEALVRMEEMTQRGFHMTRSVSLLEHISKPAGSSTLGQRMSAFRESGLLDGKGHPLSYYVVMEAVYDLYQNRVDRGEDPEVAATHLKGFARGVGAALDKEKDDDELIVAFVEKAAQSGLPLSVLSRLGTFTGAKYHLENSLEFLELMSRPVAGKTAFEQVAGFSESGLLEGRRPVNNYGVKKRGLGLLHQYWEQGMTYQEGVDAVARALKVIEEGQLEKDGAMGVFELSSPSPLPASAVELVRGYRGQAGYELLEKVYGARLRIPRKQRERAFEQLNKTRRPSSSRMTDGLVLDLYDAWAILVGRGGMDPKIALNQVRDLLTKLDEGGEASRLGTAIRETVDLLVEESVAHTEINFEDDHVIVGDVGLPVAD